MAPSNKAGAAGQAAALPSNVISLFSDERAPVINVPRRGRLPHGVTNIRSRPRLMPGDVAEMCGKALPANHGKRVRLICRNTDMEAPGEFWKVEAIDQDLTTIDMITGAVGGAYRVSNALASNLRRCAAPNGGRS